MQAAVNGTEIFYETDGDGPVCFVLHGGLGIDHTVYRKTLQPLAKEMRLVFPDFRGNGRSGRPPLESITMEQLADDVVGLADALGVDRFFVLGHSYGGFVAQELAIRHSHRLEGAVLVATRAGLPGETDDFEKFPLPPRPSGLVDLDAVEQTDAAIASKYWHDTTPYFTGDETVDELRSLFTGTVYEGPTRMRGREVLAGWSAVDRLHAIKCPTMVIAGELDLVAGPADGKRIADRIPNATLNVVPGAHHWPWVEKSQEFYSSVCEWFGQQQRRIARSDITRDL